MNIRLIALLVLAAIGAALNVAAQDAKGDLEKIQGQWSVTAMERDEKPAPAQAIEGLTITFTEDKMTLARAKGKAREYTFKLNPAKSPKAIDFVPLDGKSKGFTIYGIYAFDGKDLKLCMPNADGTERPTEFKTKKDSDLILMSLTPAKK
jgi:uncharacterized protein (TIGR03067 family)